MDAAELDRLEALARAATPGPWWTRPDEPHVYPDSWMRPGRTDVEFDPASGYAKDGGGVIADTGYGHQNGPADAAYIAAVSPDKLLALIAKLRGTA